MGERYSIQAICPKCNIDLGTDQEYGRELMMPVGEYIDLTCPKCGIVWRFWMIIETKHKKVGQKKEKTPLKDKT